jgi:hypothetical protein
MDKEKPPVYRIYWCGGYSAWGLPCDEYIREDKS